MNIHFIRLLVLAYMVAIPVAWYIMHSWLQSFAYRTSLNIWIPAVAAFIALLVTVVTVSVLSFRTAQQNPVNALRTD